MRIRYEKKNKAWAKLDNAAKIFPPTTTAADPKVFRFTCEFYENVDAGVLQAALDETMPHFPGLSMVIKHGVFWYYMEMSDEKPVVVPEDKPVCFPLFDRNTHHLLLSVNYYRKRMNIEMYHALSDGTGAVEFLKTLSCNYVALKHSDVFQQSQNRGIIFEPDSTAAQKMEDSFNKYYNPGSKRAAKGRTAYRLRGAKLPENRLKVIQGILSVSKTLAAARQRGTTITVLLTALIIWAIHEEMSLKDEKRPVSLAVPVNLRNYFPSGTTRNFFGIHNISYDFTKEKHDLESITGYVTRSFKDNLTKEKLAERMNNMASIEHNYAIRAVPLIIKDPVMKAGYAYSTRVSTATVSNLGRIELPPVFAPYIRLFGVLSSTKKMQCSICSYGDNMVVSFTDHFLSADIQKHFFRQLSAMGIPAQIVSVPFEKGASFKHDNS